MLEMIENVYKVGLFLLGMRNLVMILVVGFGLFYL